MPARQRQAVIEAEEVGVVEGFGESEGAVVPLHEGAVPSAVSALGAAVVPDGVDAGHWRMVTAAAPWLTVADGLVVKALCHALADYDQARAQVEAHGVMVMAKSGELIPNPWYKVVTERRAELVKLAREVGLTPLVRQRM